MLHIFDECVAVQLFQDYLTVEIDKTVLVEVNIIVNSLHFLHDRGEHLTHAPNGLFLVIGLQLLQISLQLPELIIHLFKLTLAWKNVFVLDQERVVKFLGTQIELSRKVCQHILDLRRIQMLKVIARIYLVLITPLFCSRLLILLWITLAIHRNHHLHRRWRKQLSRLRCRHIRLRLIALLATLRIEEITKHILPFINKINNYCLQYLIYSIVFTIRFYGLKYSNYFVNSILRFNLW